MSKLAGYWKDFQNLERELRAHLSRGIRHFGGVATVARQPGSSPRGRGHRRQSARQVEVRQDYVEPIVDGLAEDMAQDAAGEQDS